MLKKPISSPPITNRLTATWQYQFSKAALLNSWPDIASSLVKLWSLNQALVIAVMAEEENNMNILGRGWPACHTGV